MITALDKHTALILIDLQEGIVHVPRIHPREELLAKVKDLIHAFRIASLPIVIVNVDPTNAPWTKSRKENTTQHASLTLSADFTKIVEEIHTKPEDILITKQTWNAFYNTPLQDALQKRNITGIVLAGIATSIGVEGTARAASELGYNISFAIDAMSDSILEAHQHSINTIFPRIGEIGDTDHIITALHNRK
ncbi:isochorismatase family protein [Sulfurospirillum diekertiae]|uniref:Isochorismatase family protein YecD n=1 Tax=Sulfurospirillum diekertiae TaxID=1854492 RepID=A0A1Y0HK86_9BACT|nr:isochorismatase family protein [Sulfurospirillum diekertiae]ARU48537.1 Isochorismatase family protein YecD [Sulfurospirillum diekertiae]ASC93369.1 Isochorismatase family protein YecD [Sulfurospirillum diekertiae]